MITSKQTVRPSRLRALFAFFVTALAASAVSGFTSNAARADDLPFWERADAVKAAGAKPSASYAKAAKKSYSANSSNKKKYAKSSSNKFASKSGKKLGGYASATEPVKKKHKGVKVAALGNSYVPQETKKSLSGGGGVRWAASSGCLDSNLRSIIGQVASNFGPVTVNSTCRNKGHNRAVGGAPKSKHLTGDAVDFRVHGNVRAVYAYLRNSGSVGGLKHYGGGLFHIDNGERRSW